MKHKRTLLIFLLLLGLLWRLAFSWQPMERLTNYPVVDDGFYSLNIARNLALGKGMTCDGVHPTNGFQPLYVFLSVPFYWLFPQNKYLPVNLVLTCLSFLSVISGLLLYKLVKFLSNEKAALFAVLLWCLSPTVVEFELNGLESGLSVFFIILSSYYYLTAVRNQNSKSSNNIILGALLGLTVLTRIDGLFFCLAMFLDYLWINRNRLKEIIQPSILIIITCILVCSPWFINNLFNFGHIMPVSGQAVRQLSLSPIISGFPTDLSQALKGGIPGAYYLSNIKQSLSKMGRAPLVEALFWPGLFLGYNWLGYLLLSLFVGGGLILLGRDWKYITATKIAQFNFILIYCAIMLIAYCFYVFGQWYYVRYYFPLLCISILYSGFFYSLLVEELIPLLAPNVGKVIKAGLLVFLFLSLNYRLTERLLTCPAWEEQKHTPYYQTARWIEQNLPPDAKLGCFQSGTIGYFVPQTVINLDGVVNQEAYLAIKEKHMLEYVGKSGIQYLVDWPDMVEAFLWQASPTTAERQKLHLIETGLQNYSVYQVVHQTR